MRSKKYFICSDIHSFYTPFRKALREAGFNPKTKSHILVILGDLFDRGEEALPLYNFITSLPKERRILIRGNHEYLLRDLYRRGFYYKFDKSNGTLDTLYQFAGISKDYLPLLRDQYYKCLDERFPFNTLENDSRLFNKIKDEYYRKLEEIDQLIYNNLFTENILKWIESDDWVNYWETDRYIFVHSFIPLRKKDIKLDGLSFDEEYSYFSNWRTEATQEEWEKATWGCPWRLFGEGYFQEEGKTLVCGHWHTSDFWNNLYGTDYNVYEHNPIFKRDDINLIGLDACTAATNQVNVLVLKEEEL